MVDWAAHEEGILHRLKEDVIYTPLAGGGPFTIDGVFFGQYAERVYRNDMVSYVESSEPSVHVKTSDVPSIAHGDAMTVRGIAYTVCNIRPDGDGVTQCLLERV